MANILYPADYSQARSPLLVQFAPQTAGQTITTAFIQAFIYTGDKTSGVPGTAQVELTKQSFGGNVLLDVSQLVRAYFVHNYTSHNAPSAATYSIAQAIGAALWVKLTTTSIESDGSYSNGSSTFLAFDGVSYFADGVNEVHAETILTTPRIVKLLAGQYFNLPVKNDPQIKWAIESGGDISTYQASLTHGDDTDKKAVYLPVGKPNVNAIGDLTMDLMVATEDYFVHVQNNATNAELGNIQIQIICEPKFDGHYIAFINKWGMWDTMLFEKKSSTMLKVESQSYRRMIGTFGTRSDEEGTQAYSYNTREGVQARINAIGQETITLNTGFLEEDYNEVMRQLLQSEVFLMDNSIPVTIETVDLEYKTGVNDRLIQYTIVFKYAYEAINRVI